MLRLAREAYLADATPACAFGHFARQHDAQQAAGAARGFNPLLASYGPALIDRAVLDALCRALGVSFYAAARDNLVGVGAQRQEFAGFDWATFLQSLQPAAAIEARHTVGLVDAITAADLQHRVNDGLPETLEQVVTHYGHHFFKLKVCGRIDDDLARLATIAAVLDRAGTDYQVSLDGNEQFEDAAGVAELLARMRGVPALARLYRSILFVEQPIARKTALEVDVHSLAAHKPIIIDESDGELDSFVQARARGYDGISSKTCKGLYKSLLNAARCKAWNAQEGQIGRAHV